MQSDPHVQWGKIGRPNQTNMHRTSNGANIVSMANTMSPKLNRERTMCQHRPTIEIKWINIETNLRAIPLGPDPPMLETESLTIRGSYLRLLEAHHFLHWSTLGQRLEHIYGQPSRFVGLLGYWSMVFHKAANEHNFVGPYKVAPQKWQTVSLYLALKHIFFGYLIAHQAR